MKVIHVHLIFKKKNYYFGSLSAIFEHLSENDIGIKKRYATASVQRGNDLNGPGDHHKRSPA